NELTKKGDVYGFGGIMYEIATRKRPFYERAHDAHLIIDIPDVMLDWIANESHEKAIKSQKREPSPSLSSSISRPQSCHISRNIHIIHGLHNSLEDIKYGKSQDPNLLSPMNQLFQVSILILLILKNPQNALIGKKNSKPGPSPNISTFDCNF
ncbi:9704_t:CDS:2, partial [Diversispora eburnea]